MKKTILLGLLAGALLATSCCGRGALPRASEEIQSRFTEAGDQVFDDVWGVACDELHSLMILKDGKVAYERWATGHTPEELHILWSASKSFTALGVCFAADEGLLSVQDKVVDYFTDEELPAERSEWLQEMTLWDLLVMSSGIGRDRINTAQCRGGCDGWAQKTLACEIMFEPGTRYDYNGMNTYLLSVVVSRVTGEKLVDYLDRKLFTPLGIEDFVWEESPEGYNSGGWGLFLSTESLAKVGQFVLQKGVWNGRQLLGEEWIADATSAQIMQSIGLNRSEEELARLKAENDWEQGYGYQIWRCRHGAVRFDGAYGQYCIILPEQNAVVVALSQSGHAPNILNSIWKNILPLL